MMKQTVFEFLNKDRPEYALERKNCTKEIWERKLNWFQRQLSLALAQRERYTSLEWQNLQDRRMNLVNADNTKMGPAAPVYQDLCEGYNDKELAKIEEIYNINITGQFKAFMKEMGRCSGGLVGWEPILLYHYLLSGIEKFSIFHEGCYENMVEYGLEIYNQNKPFCFSCENENLYYFMMTGSDDPELVYCLDDNVGIVSCAGMQFIDYMKDVIIREAGQGLPVICKGDLLFDLNNKPFRNIKSKIKQFITNNF